MSLDDEIREMVRDEVTQLIGKLEEKMEDVESRIESVADDMLTDKDLNALIEHAKEVERRLGFDTAGVWKMK